MYFEECAVEILMVFSLRSEGGLVGDVDDQAAVVDTQLELRQCFDK
jgi:hypothetical protein